MNDRAGGFRDRVWPAAAVCAVRALGTTLRVSVIGAGPLAPLWAARRPLIYIVWHGRILMAPWANARLRRSHGARGVTVLASRSRDGELIARYVERFALGVVRGSSSHGGASALRSLAAAVKAGEDVVIVPDGPRGPRGVLAPGVVALAALTGAPVVPFALSARPAVTLASWDAFQIPLPWSRLAVAFGAPVVVAADADRDVARRDLTVALDAATAMADRLVRTTPNARPSTHEFPA